MATTVLVSSAFAKPIACPDGTFAVEGTPFTTGAASPTAPQVILAGGQLTLRGVCAAGVPARVRAGKRVTKVTAAFPACGGTFPKAGFKATIASPACDTLRGVLTVKRAKPAKRRFTATRLPEPATLVEGLRTDAARRRMANENLPAIMRLAAEPLNPEVATLVAAGADAITPILAAFDGTANLFDDVPLCLLAYALERIGDPRAVPVLVEWLQANLFGPVLFADEFVTHTIKVLTGQPSLNTTTYTYLIDEMLDTIARARSAPAALLQAAPRAAAEVTEARNKCSKTIRVVGLNAQGQEVSVPIEYKTVFFDLDQQIELASGAKQSGLATLQKAFRDDDERVYGSSDYRPIGDVSVASNCGGSVTERLLNAVAEQKGFAIRLGTGNTGADDIRNLARTFGNEISGSAMDTLTVIAHQREAGDSAHVEIPQSVSADASSAVVYSKDNQGRPRLHTVSRGSFINAWGPVQQRYNFRPFANLAQTTPHFYRIDPSRILRITIDSSGCPCDYAFGGVVPVAITQPVAAEVPERVLTVAGTIGDSAVTDGTLRVNGSAQGLTLTPGAFASEVVLSSGDNQVRVAVDAPDGRRGCAERTIRSSTPLTTVSATLTWSLDGADVDLYVTQPDGETAYYSVRNTTIGGRLDVDNTSGLGPENYFLSLLEGDTIVPGAYAIKVHYYRDQQQDDQHPARAVTWRVVVIVNEGTPRERREIHGGTISTANSSNATPGSAGPDWALVTSVTP